MEPRELAEREELMKCPWGPTLPYFSQPLSLKGMSEGVLSGCLQSTRPVTDDVSELRAKTQLGGGSGQASRLVQSCWLAV